MIYRSNHSEVLAVWDELNERYSAWVQRVQQWGDDNGFKPAVIRVHNEMLKVAGVLDDPDDKGWVKEAKAEYWRPSRRNRVGKTRQRELDELTFRIADLPGMPKTFWTADRLYRYGVEQLGVDIWVTWGHDGVDEQVDSDLWTQETLESLQEARKDAGLDNEGLPQDA
jgi:hypothetical protein